MSILDWQDSVFKAVLTLLTGLTTGFTVVFYTAKYAVKRFYSEKWWEKRLASFMDVINIAYEIKQADEYWLAAAEEKHFPDGSFVKLSTEKEKKLREEQNIAMKAIIRMSHLSSLTLSLKASELLAEYCEEYNKIYPAWWADELDELEASQKSLKIISSLLDGLLKEARTELKLDL